jgi:hypothetical protein
MEPSCSGDSHDRMTAFVLRGSPIKEAPQSSRGRTYRGESLCGANSRTYACLSVSCAAGENARRRISKIATMLVMPDAARIIATMMN